MTQASPRDGARRAIIGMTSAYLLFLAWAVLWKCGAPFIGGVERVINLIPLHANTSWELQLNVGIFIPMGFYIAACGAKPKIILPIIYIILITFALEATQYILAIGRSDVTDILMNTLGGVIGVIAHFVMAILFGRHARRLALAICILFTAFTIYMATSFVIYGRLNLGVMTLRL